jgi:phosphoglycerate dehydrogenase-like enzyme
MTGVLCAVPLEQAELARLQALPGVHVEALGAQRPDWELPATLLAGQQVLLCKFPPKNLFDLPDLKLMQLATVGYEHLRSLGLAERPLRVCNARGIFDTAIGEWCLAMMVNLTRDLAGMFRNQQERVWDRSARFQEEIRGRVLGLWGYGGIGRETARLAKAFGLTVHVMTRSGVRPRPDTYRLPGTGDPDGLLPDRVFTAAQELDFLGGLDFLVLALPHTRHSEGLVGARELRAMRPTSFLLNPARGPIVQEQPLLQALREGWIAGAALDTHFAYPLPPQHPLWSMPNVILTPHVAGADRSRQFPPRMGDLFAQNVERYVAGLPLLNELTPAEWREA